MAKNDLRKEDFIKKIEKEKKEMLKDCWIYHKELMKQDNPKLKKGELEDFLYNISLTDWEDVGYFVGVLRGLDEAITILDSLQ